MAGPGVPEVPGGGETEPTLLPEIPAEKLVERPEVPGVLPRVVAEVDTTGAPVINYYFPVQVEVIGQLDDAQMKTVADYVFEQLNAELRRRE